jgi:hypothetical protein
MNRLIFVPQCPTHLRYQQFWFFEFPEQFRKYFDSVLVLGENYYLNETKHKRNNTSMFSPINTSIDFETQQIKEYMNIDITSNDILFLADISFPGFFTGVLYHKPCPKMYAFCHASAKNAYDYWAPVRKYKWGLECQHAKLFNKIFVGTKYHQRKLGWKNTIVTGLPDPPFPGYGIKTEKTIDIISVARPNIQKINKKVEKKVEKKFGKIVRTCEINMITNWISYYRYLKMSKVLLLTSKEETWGYQVIDAVLNNCIPIAPNKFSYPELLPKKYLYDSYEELENIIKKALDYSLETPYIKLYQMRMIDNFYANICGVMKKRSNKK